MKESIIKLCHEVLKNDGVNASTHDCSGIDCAICPFEFKSSSCQELTRSQNIEIANKYLMEINNI